MVQKLGQTNSFLLAINFLSVDIWIGDGRLKYDKCQANLNV